jgi:hypothetical protein
LYGPPIRLALKALLVSSQSSDTGHYAPTGAQKLADVLFNQHSSNIPRSDRIHHQTRTQPLILLPQKELESNQHQLLDAIELPDTVLYLVTEIIQAIPFRCDLFGLCPSTVSYLIAMALNPQCTCYSSVWLDRVNISDPGPFASATGVPPKNGNAIEARVSDFSS